MRLTIESTDERGSVLVNGVEVPARIWLGKTPRGNRCLVFVTRIGASGDAQGELGAELQDVTSLTNEAAAPPPAEPPGTPDWETMTETVVVVDELVAGRGRIETRYNWYRLVIEGHAVWIEPRPAYFDRGRFSANYEGSFYIDAADGFPRYYMSLDVAKSEMKAWLLHRIACERRKP
jgi:hypothetical protein